jgi:hypothetical protein
LIIQILFPFVPGVAKHTGESLQGEGAKKATGLKRPLVEQGSKDKSKNENRSPFRGCRGKEV